MCLVSARRLPSQQRGEAALVDNLCVRWSTPTHMQGERAGRDLGLRWRGCGAVCRQTTGQHPGWAAGRE